ncbi:uncharacterized protein LOC143601438 [Bidens hawaiensis]|uniref:uncharacterized protein LOC143601438 n=1 Tax=Bidens hawaiensis TaxID=980011 RepID=UPI0040498AB7
MSQFIGERTTDFCVAWGIKIITSMPVHPQVNGQAESLNKIIVNNLKKKLGTKKGKSAKELQFLLRANQTKLKNATWQTPFSLVFGTEALIPTEMVIPTTRSCLRNPETNNQDLADDLNVVDED